MSLVNREPKVKVKEVEGFESRGESNDGEFNKLFQARFHVKHIEMLKVIAEEYRTMSRSHALRLMVEDKYKEIMKCKSLVQPTVPSQEE